jgi:hypothetical protein
LEVVKVVTNNLAYSDRGLIAAILKFGQQQAWPKHYAYEED